jgi:hypothetical protein
LNWGVREVVRFALPRGPEHSSLKLTILAAAGRGMLGSLLWVVGQVAVAGS